VASWHIRLAKVKVNIERDHGMFLVSSFDARRATACS
jgi:hypothetical protein